MEYSTIEKMFAANNFCDKKHKLNTTLKPICLDVVDGIERFGITSERINELSADGFDIYKYQTQITIHGLCKELNNERVNGYKCLTLNNNLSIGIKYIAVDSAKKHTICNKLNYFGWSTKSSSTELHPFMMQRFKNGNDAIIQCNEYNEIAKRIDRSLFCGSYSIFIGTWMGMYYAVFDLFVDAIIEENVNILLEQITGKTISEIDSIIAIKDSEKKVEYDALTAKYEAEKATRKERKEIQRLQIVESLKSFGFLEVNSKDVKNNTKFIAVEESYDCFKTVKYLKTARTCKPVDDWTLKNNNLYNLYNKLVWIEG
jgi:hypothetical protein